jgi:MoxR-like ATPase
VTAAGKKYPLDNPFFVLATQNPIEQEGTYPLPEAQLDRFMFNVWLDYPKYQEELQVVKLTTANIKVQLKKILSAEEIVFFQDLIRKISVADNVVEYAVKLVNKTRLNSEFSSEEAKKYFGQKVDLYVDGEVGDKASTLISFEGNELKILREGAVDVKNILK